MPWTGSWSTTEVQQQRIAHERGRRGDHSGQTTSATASTRTVRRAGGPTLDDSGATGLVHGDRRRGQSPRCAATAAATAPLPQASVIPTPRSYTVMSMVPDAPGVTSSTLVPPAIDSLSRRPRSSRSIDARRVRRRDRRRGDCRRRPARPSGSGRSPTRGARSPIGGRHPWRRASGGEWRRAARPPRPSRGPASVSTRTTPPVTRPGPHQALGQARDAVAADLGP